MLALLLLSLTNLGRQSRQYLFSITMADPKNTASSRLTQITDFLTMNKTATTIPWDPNSTKFPTRKELPDIPGAPKEAAWVWGTEDYVR